MEKSLITNNTISLSKKNIFKYCNIDEKYNLNNHQNIFKNLFKCSNVENLLKKYDEKIIQNLMDFIFEQKMNEESIENLLSLYLLSIELVFEELKIEILHLVNEMINDQNIYQFINLSVPQVLKGVSLGDFILIILKKKTSIKFDSKKVDSGNLRYILEQRTIKKIDFVIPERNSDFQKKLNELVSFSYFDSSNSDFIIKSNSKEFHVHKNVMSNLSFLKVC
jgi:hypothetical protein